MKSHHSFGVENPTPLTLNTSYTQMCKSPENSGFLTGVPKKGNGPAKLGGTTGADSALRNPLLFSPARAANLGGWRFLVISIRIEPPKVGRWNPQLGSYDYGNISTYKWNCNSKGRKVAGFTQISWSSEGATDAGASCLDWLMWRGWSLNPSGRMVSSPPAFLHSFASSFSLFLLEAFLTSFLSRLFLWDPDNMFWSWYVLALTFVEPYGWSDLMFVDCVNSVLHPTKHPMNKKTS